MKARTVLILSTAVLLVLMGGTAPAQQAAPAQGDGSQPGGIWMPPSASTYGPDVDFMYDVIFYITTAVFILVQGLLLGFCVLYRRRPGHRPAYTHGSNAAELAWTISPAAILLGLAIWQIPAWNKAKIHFPKPGESNVVRIHVIGEQFKWNVRYVLSKEEIAKYEATLPRASAGYGPIFVPFGSKVVIDLRSKDVIHSLFIPHMRAKQDAVPGLRNRLWFEPSRMPVVSLRKSDGTPAREGNEQALQWISDPKAFDAGGAFYEKKVAFQRYENFIDKKKHTTRYVALVPNRGESTPEQEGAAMVKALHQGKVVSAKWGECDYAIGIMDIACAELCGPNHFTMAAALHVVPRFAYDVWMKDLVSEEDEGVDGAWKAWRD